LNPTETHIVAQPATSGTAASLSESDLAMLQTAIPESGKALARDTLAFWKALPRLLAEGEEGRYALVHQGNVVSLWDSLGDATQAGFDKFGDEARFSTPCIKGLEMQRILQFLAQTRAKSCGN
jgi:hypothetical protein